MSSLQVHYAASYELVCSNAVNNHFLRDVHLAKVYLLRALSLQPTAAPETTREILNENLLTVDELKPLEGFAFQFLVCRPLRLQVRTRGHPSHSSVLS